MYVVSIYLFASIYVVSLFIVKPKLKLTISSSTPILGNEFQIQCRDSEGDPLPQFSWFYNGAEIISGEKGYMIYNQSEDVSVLNISQIRFSHAGSYKCEATNTAGTTTKTTSVEVLCKSVVYMYLFVSLSVCLCLCLSLCLALSLFPIIGKILSLFYILVLFAWFAN